MNNIYQEFTENLQTKFHVLLSEHISLILSLFFFSICPVNTVSISTKEYSQNKIFTLSRLFENEIEPGVVQSRVHCNNAKAQDAGH